MRMKIQNLILILFLFFMIGVSIFFSSSPFSIVSNYFCSDVVVNGTNIHLCGATTTPDSLSKVGNLINQAGVSNANTTDFTLSIVQNGTQCYYTNEVKCLGQEVTNGQITGKQYIIKQVYSTSKALCSKPQNVTFYYTDCTQNTGNVCIASRCVKYQYQVTFYKFMELIGFKP